MDDTKTLIAQIENLTKLVVELSEQCEANRCEIRDLKYEMQDLKSEFTRRVDQF
jgi:chromosome segregation ATPase